MLKKNWFEVRDIQNIFNKCDMPYLIGGTIPKNLINDVKIPAKDIIKTMDNIFCGYANLFNSPNYYFCKNDEELSDLNTLASTLENSLGVKTTIKNNDEFFGNFGNVLQIKINKTTYALKYFIPACNQAFETNIFAHGYIAESRSALYISKSAQKKLCKEFYFGNLCRDYAYIFSEWVENNKEISTTKEQHQLERIFNPKSSDRVLLHNDIDVGRAAINGEIYYDDQYAPNNIINGKVIDFGGILENLLYKRHTK
ncbi:MAG: hypothetical protein LBL75_04045 [Rickettsiales bacterium]|nr:hypothetical protein [Rickettsiales bacterium]